MFFLPQVLAELKEYATEVDVDFVRKAVRAIGRCAIKVEVSSFYVLAPNCSSESLMCTVCQQTDGCPLKNKIQFF